MLANDTDVDGGTMRIDSVSQPDHGVVTRLGGGVGLTYTPAHDYCGADSFTYSLEPGDSSATVSVEVTCVDDAPVAHNDSKGLSEHGGATEIDVLANDTDVDGGPKTIVARTNGEHGTVTIAPDGLSLSYDPAPGHCGPDSFAYTLNGGSSATVSVNVSCLQPPPKEDGSPRSTPEQTVTRDNPSATIINITPGVGVISGRRRPRIAIKGSYAFFTLTCMVKERPCAGRVTIVATLPTTTLGPSKRLKLVNGRYRIPGGRSVLVRSRITRQGLAALAPRRNMRGVLAQMAIADVRNGERGEIDVVLVKRPKASLLD